MTLLERLGGREAITRGIVHTFRILSRRPRPSRHEEAAGVSGIAPGWAALANFLVTLAALPLGRALGDKLAGRLLGKYALPLSGALLVLLGIWEAVG